MRKLSCLILAVSISIAALAQNRETRSVNTFTKISFRVPGQLYLRQGTTQKVELEGDKEVLKEIETRVEGNKLIIGREDKWNWGWGDNDKVRVYVTIKDLEGLSVAGSGDLIGETKFVAGNVDLNVSGSGSLQLDVDASGDIEADVSGSGDMDLKGRCKDFESDVSGSGSVTLSMVISGDADFGVSGSGKVIAKGGSAKNIKIAISGSGKVLAADLEANRSEVRISGSGDAEIYVKEEIDATISGSGSVRYKGNPSRVNSNSSGSGKVSKF